MKRLASGGTWEIRTPHRQKKRARPDGRRQPWRPAVNDRGIDLHRKNGPIRISSEEARCCGKDEQRSHVVCGSRAGTRSARTGVDPGRASAAVAGRAQFRA